MAALILPLYVYWDTLMSHFTADELEIYNWRSSLITLERRTEERRPRIAFRIFESKREHCISD